MRLVYKPVCTALTLLIASSLSACSPIGSSFSLFGFNFQSKDTVATLTEATLAQQAATCARLTSGLMDSWKKKTMECEAVVARNTKVENDRVAAAKLAQYKETAKQARDAIKSSLERKAAEVQTHLDQIAALSQEDIQREILMLLTSSEDQARQAGWDEGTLTVLEKSGAKNLAAPDIEVSPLINVQSGKAKDDWSVDVFYSGDTVENPEFGVVGRKDVRIEDLTDLDTPTNFQLVANLPVKQGVVTLSDKHKKKASVTVTVQLKDGRFVWNLTETDKRTAPSN